MSIVNFKRTVAAMALACGVGAPASVLASAQDYFEMTSGMESGGDYSIQNPNDSAFGRYQIIRSNWEDMGYIKPGSTSWNDAVFTEKATKYGVRTFSDLGNTAGGKAMQDAAAVQLANGMWNGINSTTRSYIGKTVHGVNVDEAAIMGATWFLGPGDMNRFAGGGFSKEALANLPNIDGILSANGCTGDVSCLHSKIMNRMGKFSGMDISEITNGEYTTEFEQLVECETDVQTALNEHRRKEVEDLVAAAQDDMTGFIQLKNPFGDMSCIDFAFTGGLDILFSVPDLSTLAQQAMQMACDKTNTLVAEATGGLSEAMNNVASSMSFSESFGPFGNLGVQANATDDFVGLNFNQGSVPGGGSSGGGVGSGGGSSNGNVSGVNFLNGPMFNEI